jgi:outer membrane protein insertion porin family
MQKGFFNSTLELEEFINYKTKKIKLVYNIKLGSRKKFIFFGNNFFSKSLLMEKIKAFGKSTAMLPTSVFIDEIIQTYSKKGFSDIDVKASQEKDKVFFVIRENKRKVVDFVEINGSKTFESSYLLKKFFKKFHKPRYFDAEILKDSINRMISFYIKQGFWDAKAIYQDLVYLKDTDKNIFIIAIDEGKRRYLKDVIIENYSELESFGPFSRFKKGKKIPFDFNLLKSQKLWLMNYFQKQGFMYIEIKPEIIEEDEAIILKWKVSSNVDQVKFGKTIILGSNKFGFNKILRELSYKEGETWDKQKLEKSIFKLRKLDIFESISLYPENISKKEDGKYVLLKVRLDDPYEFRFRAGFQQVSKNFTFRSGTTYKLGGSFIYKNPFNLGDLFRTDLDFTRYYRNMMFQYGVPWLFNMPVSGLFKAYNNKYIQPIFIGNKDPLYEAVHQGFLVGLSKKHLKWDVGLNLGFEWMETTKLSDSVARAIDFSRELVDKKVPYFFIEPNLMIDNLDDKLNPKIGTFTVLSIKGMQPLKQEFIEFGFLKFLFSQSMFFPLGDIVFGLRLRMGHIFSQKFNSIMPVERFYLGGANSVRSYDPDMCPPLGVYVNKHNQVEHVPRGGRSMVNLNLEVSWF